MYFNSDIDGKGKDDILMDKLDNIVNVFNDPAGDPFKMYKMMENLEKEFLNSNVTDRINFVSRMSNKYPELAALILRIKADDYDSKKNS